MHTHTRAVRVAAVVVAAAAASPYPQPTSDSPHAPPPNGPKSAEPTFHALTGVTLHPKPGETVDNATIVIRDGRIQEVIRGSGRLPAGAAVHDLDGMHVYAAFIEPFAEVETPAPEEDAPGLHWNPLVTPQRHALQGKGLPESARAAHRAMGFGAAAIAPQGGIFAGQAAMVCLGDAPEDDSAAFDHVYANTLYHTVDFETAGGFPTRSYPTSHPGVVAVMRQTLSDADWQDDNDTATNAITPLQKDALIPGTNPPLLFHCELILETFLAADVAAEFGRSAILVGNGEEYKYLDGIARLDLPMVLPLRFPKAPDVSTVGKANSVELEDMMAWEHAPANPARLAERGVTFALTATNLIKGQDFHDNLRKAIRHGLAEDDALAALTTVPAQMLGVDDQLGTVDRGKRANLIVASGPIFDEDTTIHDVWVDGRRHEINPAPGPSFDGVWKFVFESDYAPPVPVALDIERSTSKKPDIDLVLGDLRQQEDDAPAEEDEEQDENEIAAQKISIEGRTISFLVARSDRDKSLYTINGTLLEDGRSIVGSGFTPEGEPFTWTADFLRAQDEDDDEDKDDAQNADDDASADIPPLPGYPFGPYAMEALPAQSSLYITGATLWTQGPQGTIEDGVLVVADGEIEYAGPKRGAPAARRGYTRLDLAGKHITPGLLDAHSHTSLFRLGVNEAGQAVTAEVRIGDSLDPAAINWYRQLAMGVTTVNSLHGSANPIGGQSMTHKIRWGVEEPRFMRMEGATPGIKFALGENVKQSNWGDRFTTRYPQTRMGVETLIRDRFHAAREYAAAGSPRRDLELEAIAEILAGERLVHCHSYRQDEILMLTRVARDFDFKIGTFQHGLEVYKVAEAVREHAIGASLFSDWWAYKVEVIDAIPFAGPLQTEAGVLTSYNSDSDELARRMNLEAAKALKYARRDADGNPLLSPEQALAFVTINPAIQLGIGDRVGSLEKGKDADFAVWSEQPMSSYAVCEHTFIDGREYFSAARDNAHRTNIAAARQRLIQKILRADGGDSPAGDGDKTAEDKAQSVPTAADTPSGERRRRSALASYMLRQIESGYHPDAPRPGDCGCGIINHTIYYQENDR